MFHPTYDPADVPGTAVLMGLDPSNPADLRIAKRRTRLDAIDAYRKATGAHYGRDARVQSLATDPETGVTLEPAGTSDPVGTVTAVDMLRRILAILTPRQKVAIVATLRGEAPATVADRMGCALGTVHATLAAARKRIRAMLD